MVPKYPMRKIHPSKNGGGLGWTFHFGEYSIFSFAICANLHWKNIISPNFPAFLFY
jgi:hypothetical protein